MPRNKGSRSKGSRPSLVAARDSPTGSTTRSETPNSDGGANCDVIKNACASSDELPPMDSLRNLQEMFSGQLEPDVVHMIFSECEYNGNLRIETLVYPVLHVIKCHVMY